MLAEAGQLRKSSLETRNRNESSATLLALHNASKSQLLDRLPDGCPTHVEPALELGLRRQHRPGLETLARDLAADPVSHLDIERKPCPLLESPVDE
jgi:hypothetical protein